MVVSLLPSHSKEIITSTGLNLPNLSGENGGLLQCRSSFFSFENIEGGAAIHAPPTLCNQHIEYGGGAIVKGLEADGFLVLAGKVIQEWGAFAERAVCLAAFEEGNSPQDAANWEHASEDVSRCYTFIRCRQEE